MQFQIASDLHIEKKGGIRAPRSAYPEANSPMLLLAGDTYPFARPDYKEIMRRVAEPFQLVLTIPGNHEYYESPASIPETNKEMREACNSIPNVMYMNKAHLNIGDTVFIGATCWTNVPRRMWKSAKSMINDYNMIPSAEHPGTTVTPMEIYNIHSDHAKWLRKTISHAKKTSSRRAVVMTHHAPSTSLSMETISRPDRVFPYYYSSDMEDFIRDPFIKTWVHGHTHESHQIVLDPWGPVFACNAAGYPFEHTGYTNNAVITIAE